jgi:glutaredoxin
MRFVGHCHKMPALLWANNISYKRIDALTKLTLSKLIAKFKREENIEKYNALQEVPNLFV